MCHENKGGLHLVGEETIHLSTGTVLEKAEVKIYENNDHSDSIMTIEIDGGVEPSLDPASVLERIFGFSRDHSLMGIPTCP